MHAQGFMTPSSLTAESGMLVCDVVVSSQALDDMQQFHV